MHHPLLFILALSLLLGILSSIHPSVPGAVDAVRIHQRHRMFHSPMHQQGNNNNNPLWRFTDGLNQISLSELRNSVLPSTDGQTTTSPGSTGHTGHTGSIESSPNSATAAEDGTEPFSGQRRLFDPLPETQSHRPESIPPDQENLGNPPEVSKVASVPDDHGSSPSTPALLERTDPSTPSPTPSSPSSSSSSSSNGPNPDTPPQGDHSRTPHRTDDFGGRTERRGGGEGGGWGERRHHRRRRPDRRERPKSGGHWRHRITRDGDLAEESEEPQEPQRPPGAPEFPPRPHKKWDFGTVPDGWSLRDGATQFPGIPPHTSLAVLDGRRAYVALDPITFGGSPFSFVLVVNPLETEREWTILSLSRSDGSLAFVLENQNGDLLFTTTSDVHPSQEEAVERFSRDTLRVPGFWEHDEWIHVGVTIDASGRKSVFKDGKFTATTQEAGDGSARTNPHPLLLPPAGVRDVCFLGRGLDILQQPQQQQQQQIQMSGRRSGNHFFTGEIDVLHLYLGTALTEDEFLRHFEYWKSVDCEVGPWSEWGPCSRDCGGGIRYRSRSVTVPQARWGLECPALGERETCNESLCNQDCEVSGWSDWSRCSVECGEGGRQVRTREILREQEGNGRACPSGAEGLREERGCSGPPCPIDCQVGEWTAWSGCSERCGGGVQSRERRILVSPEHGGQACPPEEERREERDCNRSPCPVDCEVSDWSEWSDCSASCGGGTTSRQRTVLVEAKYAGAPCPEPLTERRECNTQECDIDCAVSEWSAWSDCTQECGSGVQERRRKILQFQSGHGAPCPPGGAAAPDAEDEIVEYRPCNTQPCEDPVDEDLAMQIALARRELEDLLLPRVILLPLPTHASPQSETEKSHPSKEKKEMIIAEIVDSVVGIPKQQQYPKTQQQEQEKKALPPRGGYVAPFVYP